MADNGSGAAGGTIAPIVGAAALGAVLVAGAVAFVALRDRGEGSVPTQTTVEVPAPDLETTTSDTGAAAPDTVAQAPPPTPDPAAAPPMPVPRFDVVRVDGTGGAVIAGQAGQGASVTLKIDGDPVEVVEADRGGNFVAMLALAPSDAPRILSLEAAHPDGAVVAGDETVIIAPFTGEAVAMAPEAETAAPTAAEGREASDPAAPRPDPALAAEPPGPGDVTGSPPEAPEAVAGTDPSPTQTLAPAAPGVQPDPEIAIAPSPEAPAGDLPAAPDTVAPDVAAAAPPADGPAPPAAPQAAPQAPAVLMAGTDGVRVLQAPGAPPGAQTEVQLDAITYDTTGDVTLAGRGPADGSVRVTLNNQPINMGEIGPGGQWSLGLPDVDPGTYTLRLEQLAADGTVTRTVSTPFLREDPARIRDNPMLVDPGASVITVQRGFTLWGIAEANFGEGILYVQIFEENRGDIRDPDLIFPGQIFALPDLPRAGPEGAGDE